VGLYRCRSRAAIADMADERQPRVLVATEDVTGETRGDLLAAVMTETEG